MHEMVQHMDGPGLHLLSLQTVLPNLETLVGRRPKKLAYFVQSLLSLADHQHSAKKLRGVYRHRGDAKKRDVRINNINAAKAVADAVRTSLGPRGMDKMVSCMNLPS